MMNNSPLIPELLTRKEVLKLTGLSRTTLFEIERAGHFPKARKLTPMGRSVRYVRKEVLNWIVEVSEKES